MTTGQTLLILVTFITIALLFVLFTDGRFFGKRITFWVYDRLGPAMFGAGSEPERWQRLADRLALRGNERILDVGTAVGDLPLTLVSQPGFTGTAVGVDWSPRMMAAANVAARQRKLDHLIQFQVVDIRHGLPFAANTFDIIFCLGLLETWPRPEQILAEFSRVLAKNGRMVLSLYRGWSSKSVTLTLNWYREHLTPLGFSSIEVVSCRYSHDAIIVQVPTNTSNSPASL